MIKYNLFKPEDFTNDDFDFAQTEIASDYANEKLNALIEAWPVVTTQKAPPKNPDGSGITIIGQQWTELIDSPYQTHQARLAFIEPIKREPCKHEPFIKGDRAYKACTICGVELVATWSAK